MSIQKDSLSTQGFDLTSYDMDPEETRKVEEAIEKVMKKIEKNEVDDKEIDNLIEALFFSSTT